MARTAAGPFLRAYRLVQREAHERPVIFYSLILGSIGPILALTVPPIRTRFFGYKPSEPIPNYYPLPQRPRRPTEGFED